MWCRIWLERSSRQMQRSTPGVDGIVLFGPRRA
jgi:hypothetical protein